MKETSRTFGKLNDLAVDRVAELEAELAQEHERADALAGNLAKSQSEQRRLSSLLQEEQKKQANLQERLRVRRYELGERVKELHGLYSISRLFEDRNLSRTEIFKGVVDAIPPSWQYPASTCARIRFAGGDVCSEGFQESPWKQSSPIKIFDESFGELEVFYSEKRPEMDEGPFLHGERELLDELARRLGVHLERLESEERAKEHERSYRELFELGLIGMAIIDPLEKRWVEVNQRLCEMLGYSAEELQFMTWSEIIHPADMLAALREFDKTLNSRDGGTLTDRRFVRKDGTLLHATNSLRAVDVPRSTERRVYALFYDITDRVLAEQRLVQNQLMIQQIFDTIDVGLCLVGKGLRVLRTNVTFARLMRLEASIMGRDLYDALAGMYVPKEFCPVQKAYVNRKVERSEHRIVYPGEGERWFEVHGYPISDSGLDAEVVMLIREITHQKQIQSALSERLDFIQTLINAVPNPIFYKDANGVYLGCNRAYEEFLQLKAADLVGKTAYDIAPKDLADHYVTRDKELLKKPGVQIYESSVRCADNEVREVLFYKATYGKYSNNPTGIVGVIVDITDRKQTEETLRENAEFLQVVLDSIQTAMILVDAETLEIVDANRNAEKLTGLKMQELLGEKCDQLLAGLAHCPHCSTRSKQCFCPYEKDSVLLNVEDTLLRPDGRSVPVLRSVLPVSLKGRRHLVEIAFDLTEHKALEQQLIYTQKLESIGHLASGIAHEIDSPIHDVGENIYVALKAHTALMTLFEALLMEHQVVMANPSAALAPAWSEVQDALRTLSPDACRNDIPEALRRSAEGLGRLAETIHGLTKFSGGASETAQPADLNAAIENTVMVSRSEWEHLAEVTTDLDPRLPLVNCRLSDFNQVLLNLLVHASKEIRKAQNGERGRIRVRSRAEGDYALISLQSIGGHSCVLKCPEYPLEPGKMANGLDELQIARNVVGSKLGGSLDMSDSLPEGCTVTVRLPFEPLYTED